MVLRSTCYRPIVAGREAQVGAQTSPAARTFHVLPNPEKECLVPLIITVVPPFAKWGDRVEVKADPILGAFSKNSLVTLTPTGRTAPAQQLATTFVGPQLLEVELPPVKPSGFDDQNGVTLCDVTVPDGLLTAKAKVSIGIGITPTTAPIDVEAIARGMSIRAPTTCQAGQTVTAQIVSKARVPGAHVVALGNVIERGTGDFIPFEGIVTKQIENQVYLSARGLKSWLAGLDAQKRERFLGALNLQSGNDEIVVNKDVLVQVLLKALDDGGAAASGNEDVGQLLYDLSIPGLEVEPGTDLTAEVVWKVSVLLDNGQRQEASREQEFHAIESGNDPLTDAQALTLILRPPIEELTKSPKSLRTRTYYLAARVRVRVLLPKDPGGVRASQQSGWVEVPEVQVVCAALLLPTVALLFIDHHYNGRFLMWVPSDSPLTATAELFKEMNKLFQTLDKLKWLTGAIGGDLAAIDLPVDPTFVFHTADYIDDFDGLPDYHALIGRKFLGVGPDDEASSMILLAAPDCPHSAIKVYAEEDRDTEGAALKLSVGPLGVALMPNIEDTDRGSMLLPFGRYDRANRPGKLNDEISSAEFMKA
jgi:hypothetical protein